jgi:hypothetical protein
MESTPQRNSSSESSAPTRRRRGRLQRITEQTQGLVQDLTSWIELRIELARLEIEERIEARANDIALGVILAGLGALTGVFGLITVALALGALLGHAAWGFLIVTVLLGVTLVVVRAAQPELVQIDLSEPPPEEGEPSTNGRDRTRSTTNA